MGRSADEYRKKSSSICLGGSCWPDAGHDTLSHNIISFELCGGKIWFLFWLILDDICNLIADKNPGESWLRNRLFGKNCFPYGDSFWQTNWGKYYIFFKVRVTIQIPGGKWIFFLKNGYLFKYRHESAVKTKHFRNGFFFFWNGIFPM